MRTDWKVRATPARTRASGRNPMSSSPPSRIEPRWQRWRPATTSMSVDLPAPLAPTRARISPASTEKVTSSSAWTPPKRCDTRVDLQQPPAAGDASTVRRLREAPLRSMIRRTTDRAGAVRRSAIRRVTRPSGSTAMRTITRTP